MVVTAARRHLPRWWAPAAIIVLAVQLGACEADPPPEPVAPACVDPLNRTPDTPPAPEAPDGGALRVSELGFSPVSGALVSIGAVIENTSDHPAYHTTVTVSVTGIDGENIVDPDGDQQLVQVIPVVAPGASTGYAALVWLRSSVAAEVPAIGTVDVSIGDSRWLDPAGDGSHSVTTATITDFRLNTASPGGGASYVMRSPYCEDVPDRGVVSIFRDNAGSVVGGSIDTPFPRGCAAGETNATVSHAALPVEFDPEQTSLYPYCDPTTA